VKGSVKANEESVEENDGKMRERMRAQESGKQNHELKLKEPRTWSQEAWGITGPWYHSKAQQKTKSSVVRGEVGGGKRRKDEGENESAGKWESKSRPKLKLKEPRTWSQEAWGITGPWNHSIKLSKKIRNEIQGIVESQKLGQAQKIIKRRKSTSHSKKSRKKLKNKLKMFYRKEVEKKKILKALPTLN
jgi:hypothetical protein